MTSNKVDILDFCESIQDLVSTMREKPLTSDLECGQKSNDLESSQLNRLEIVEFEPEQIGSIQMDVETQQSSGEGPSTGVIPKRGRGRPRKNATTISSIAILEDSSDYDFMRQVDNSSRSSWSEH